MKVALLTNGLYPFQMGGMQKHSYYLARYLAQKGVQVDVYSYKLEASEKEKIDRTFTSGELENLRFFEIEFPISAYFPGHYLFNSYRHACSIYKKLKENIKGVDFIYAQGFTGWKLLLEKNSLQPSPPVGVNFHGLEMFQKTANLRSKMEQYLFKYPAKLCLQKADIAISLGGKLTQILKNKAGNSTTIWETPIGIEEKWLIDKVASSKKRRKFIFIGRYERRKGIQELNNVVKKLQGKQAFDFEFIGPIPEGHKLKLSNCHYHGPIYDEDNIIKIISGGDVLVCPSYSEGMPTVILEAMSRGLAVIATDVGAVSELVSSETGWLIEAANQPQLEDAMVRALNVPESELLQKKSAALKLIKNRFTWGKVIDITLDKIKDSLPF